MRQEYKVPAVLALADGTIYRGFSFGAQSPRPSLGEVVFNTSMYGYQEILTDPSYAGQIITFTYPHIGNVGCNDEDNESDRVHVQGMIIRELSKVTSNFRSRRSLSEYLRAAGVMGLYGIDTRELVSHIRTHGAQMGAMASGERINSDELVDMARAAGSMEGKDYVKQVSCKKPYVWDELPWSLAHGGGRRLSQEKLVSRPHVVAVDCGIKRHILRLLLDTGFRVTVVPATSTSSEILALKPDGLFLSNGPGDPATLEYVVQPAKELLGKVPMFGICLGHQVLAQAVGGTTYKLKFGHRGGNHPVKDFTTNKVEITVQNHGFAVGPNTLRDGVEVTHVNLNDQTIEGLQVPEAEAFSVQYHPEAAPGPHDARYLFQRFFDSVVKSRE